MAAWQFVFDLIPSSAVRMGDVIAAHMSREQLEGMELYCSRSEAEALFDRIHVLLPEKKSWSPCLRIWGDEETNDVQIFIGDEAIEGVQFRLDVARLEMPLVVGICALARDFECVFATRSGAIIRPHRASLLRAIMQSNASRYVNNPERYIREIAQRDPEPI